MLFSKNANYYICKSIMVMVYDKYYYLDYYLHHVLTEIFVNQVLFSYFANLNAPIIY